jgi:hypothetical protein
LTISAAGFLSDVAESFANFAVNALDRKDRKEPRKGPLRRSWIGLSPTRIGNSQ